MKPYSLDDKYLLESGRVYLSGIQALVRLPIDQMRRDRREGLNTGAFISGYEGSPLGGYDLALARARSVLADFNIHFVPGVNEDLAATSVFGSQISDILGARKVDGVLGIWYGKGPGVDRSGDILRHANLAGTGKGCAALVLAGDDHGSKSSTIPHQSDLSLYNLAIPTFYPGNTQEILDFGLQAIALSRWSGAWVAMKMVTNVCDGGGTVEVNPQRTSISLPPGYQKMVDARLVPPLTLAMEPQANRARLEAAQEFARVNRVNRWFGAWTGAWLGIAAAGKAYYDLMQALADLGLTASDLEALGVRVAQFGMIFPVERRFALEFTTGLSTLLVIEEKRSFLELQLREALYNQAQRPAVIGKEDEEGKPLFPASGELDPDIIARALATRLAERSGDRAARMEQRAELLRGVGQRPPSPAPPRRPNFCSGCPHNRSTLLLPGQVAGGGIGCHGMGMMLKEINRGYEFITHMGGEGAPWIGMAPFVERQHIFQNIGDGTFAHSGQLAINACVAAGVNITYKILYNRAVAMTGGQDAAGALTVPALTRKLEAEGVKRTVVLAEDPRIYEGVELARNASVGDRRELEAVLAEMEKIPGVTAIIYDQRCAAEKRRLRARGKLEEPARRLVIHEEVCEGCGDCVKQSNCLSLYPVDTELGQKMRIHQSSCNKDYSCALGDCPSFVTVYLHPGAGQRRRQAADLPPVEIDPPKRRAAIPPEGYRILAPGIGGTGVVTVNAVLATAALLDGLHVMTLDQTGLAQKGGAVVSHLILSEKPLAAAAKINAGNADLLLGFDLLGAAAGENLRTAHPERTVAVINTAEIPSGDAIRARRTLAGPQLLVDQIDACTRRGYNIYLDANRVAEDLFGTHLAANLFLTGAAWQAGLLPVSADAVERAIRLNGVDAERNLRVFRWGRKYYEEAAWVEKFLRGTKTKPEAVWDVVEDRCSRLKAYQNRRTAAKFRAWVEQIAERQPALRDAVARHLYKLIANKDEYEVARLLTSPAFERQLEEQWESIARIEYNLHPPLLRAWGWKKKLRLGPGFRYFLKVLAAFKWLRGTPLDIFGYSSLRRLERSLPAWYRRIVEEALDLAGPDNLAAVEEIAALPGDIRGYENIRRTSIAAAQKRAEEKLEALRATAQPPVLATQEDVG